MELLHTRKTSLTDLLTVIKFKGYAFPVKQFKINASSQCFKTQEPSSVCFIDD